MLQIPDSDEKFAIFKLPDHIFHIISIITVKRSPTNAGTQILMEHISMHLLTKAIATSLVCGN